MRAHDRTLISSLGFADRDKQDRRHDLACQYLSDHARVRYLAEMMIPEPSQSGGTNLGGEVLEDGTETTEFGRIHSVILESPISKGEGKYKTTVGFMDLLCNVVLVKWWEGKWRESPRDEYVQRKRTREVYGQFAIEVKIGEVGSGEILRQINLYREFNAPQQFVCATAYVLPQVDVDTLAKHRVRHVVLGKGFTDFCRESEVDGDSKTI
jgi:hypothetical protein